MPQTLQKGSQKAFILPQPSSSLDSLPGDLSETLMLSSLESGKVSKSEIIAQKNELLQEYAHFNKLKNDEARYLKHEIAIQMRKEELHDAAYYASPEVAALREFSDTDFRAFEYTNSVRLNTTRAELREFRNKNFSSSAYDPGIHGTKAGALSHAFMRHDLATMVGADLSERDTEKLGNVYILLGNNTAEDKNRNLVEAAKLINEYNDSIPAYLKEMNWQIDLCHKAFRDNDTSKVESEFKQIVTPLLETEWARGHEEMRVKLLSSFRNTRIEGLEEVGYSISRSSEILSEKADRLLHLSKEDFNKLPTKDQELAQELQRTFWDTEIPWQNTAEHETDVRFANASYATLKRYSALISSLESKLIEIDNSNDDNETIFQKRQDAVQQLWGRYHETKDLVELEASKAIKSLMKENSQLENQETRNALYRAVSNQALLARNDETLSPGEKGFYQFCKGSLDRLVNSGEFTISAGTGLESEQSNSEASEEASLIQSALKPYYALQQAAASIPEGQEVAAYSENDFRTSYDSLRKTSIIINHSFSQIRSFLHQAQAAPSRANEDDYQHESNSSQMNIEKLLSTFASDNKEHPESKLIQEWASKFQSRYSEIFELYR